jgi:diguanylate cyclase (GGDEF)-like protein
MLSGRSFQMFGKLAHVRSRRDVVLASLVITAVSVVLSVVLTALAIATLGTNDNVASLWIAAEVAAVIAFALSYGVVDAIRRIVKGKLWIERLAMTDDLTGLPNRRAFVVAAEDSIAGADAGETPHALLIVDLDHFKRVNDLHGHRAGDQALHAAAQALLRSLRADVDWVGRLGGEEFVALVAAADEAVARRAAESARAAIEALRVETSSAEIAVTASIGVTPLVAGDNVASALQRADEALYAAKRAGRNQVSWRSAQENASLLEDVRSRRRGMDERWRRLA